MHNADDNVSLSIIKIVQELLGHESGLITPCLIDSKIDAVLMLYPTWKNQFSRDEVLSELIRRYSAWVGASSFLTDQPDHKAWLTNARKKDWKYWPRYRQYLEASLFPDGVNAMDRLTDEILGLLEDPKDNSLSCWDKRGLVVGHVQSGKTSNYNGLICKAADSGFKIIIVLAGLHNNLRTQTQIRLEEGFLGYKTTTPGKRELVGVGLIDSDQTIFPNYATTRQDNGDFNTRAARHLGITPEQRPWLFVVKKNSTVLNNLLRWLNAHVADLHDSNRGRKIISNLPLLMIDDEADNASVDTGETVLNEDGTVNEEHQPSVINSCIRQILHSFARSAYIGFTATPFANIFIHEKAATKMEGPDLFPQSFIYNLGSSSEYVGPAQLFGKISTDGRTGGMPLMRYLDEIDETVTQWLPAGHKSDFQPGINGLAELPVSLKDAILTFLIASAIRTFRGDGKKHSSMLIHVTRFKNVQSAVYKQVTAFLEDIRQRMERKIGCEQIQKSLFRIYQEDFVSTTEQMIKSGQAEEKNRLPAWSEIEKLLLNTVCDCKTKLINGNAKDILDYVENEASGLKVIAIGGDKLSRGLTLEGLCVSYFLRASKMYDTLMQMGRWFGFRNGYLDLCRLFTTRDLVEWFEFITDASLELREEFDNMVACGATPRTFGLKVKTHPKLVVTSRLKMRNAIDLYLSFSGEILETVAFLKNPDFIRQNYQTTLDFINDLPEENRTTPFKFKTDQVHSSRLWKNIPSEKILAFLSTFKTHPDSCKVNAELIASFIRQMNQKNELRYWSVAVISGSLESDPLLKVNYPKRKCTERPGSYSIGRLLSPIDEAIDLSPEAYKAALDLTKTAWKSDPQKSEKKKEPEIPNGPSIRRIKGFGENNLPATPEKGLLLIYPVKLFQGDAETEIGSPCPFIGFGISFPESNNSEKVKFAANSVYLEGVNGDI